MATNKIHLISFQLAFLRSDGERNLQHTRVTQQRRNDQMRSTLFRHLKPYSHQSCQDSHIKAVMNDVLITSVQAMQLCYCITVLTKCPEAVIVYQPQNCILIDFKGFSHLIVDDVKFCQFDSVIKNIIRIGKMFICRICLR